MNDTPEHIYRLIDYDKMSKRARLMFRTSKPDREHTAYVREDIHQVALDRIAALEGLLSDAVSAIRQCQDHGYTFKELELFKSFLEKASLSDSMKDIQAMGQAWDE